MDTTPASSWRPGGLWVTYGRFGAVFIPPIHSARRLFVNKTCCRPLCTRCNSAWVMCLKVVSIILHSYTSMSGRVCSSVPFGWIDFCLVCLFLHFLFVIALVVICAIAVPPQRYNWQHYKSKRRRRPIRAVLRSNPRVPRVAG